MQDYPKGSRWGDIANPNNIPPRRPFGLGFLTPDYAYGPLYESTALLSRSDTSPAGSRYKLVGGNVDVLVSTVEDSSPGFDYLLALRSSVSKPSLSHIVSSVRRANALVSAGLVQYVSAPMRMLVPYTYSFSMSQAAREYSTSMPEASVHHGTLKSGSATVTLTTSDSLIGDAELSLVSQAPVAKYRPVLTPGFNRLMPYASRYVPRTYAWPLDNQHSDFTTAIRNLAAGELPSPGEYGYYSENINYGVQGGGNPNDTTNMRYNPEIFDLFTARITAPETVEAVTLVEFIVDTFASPTALA